MDYNNSIAAVGGGVFMFAQKSYQQQLCRQ